MLTGNQFISPRAKTFSWTSRVVSLVARVAGVISQHFCLSDGAHLLTSWSDLERSWLRVQFASSHYRALWVRSQKPPLLWKTEPRVVRMVWTHSLSCAGSERDFQRYFYHFNFRKYKLWLKWYSNYKIIKSFKAAPQFLLFGHHTL